MGKGRRRSSPICRCSSNIGSVPSFRFHEHDCASPLPRAYQWADGSAYVNHVELVRKARGAEMPETFWTDPLIYQGGSDCFLNPRDPIPALDEAHGIDFEAEVAVITGDVPMARHAARRPRRRSGSSCSSTTSRLRNLIPTELGKGFGFFQSKPASALSPIAVTPDELGDGVGWRQAASSAALERSTERLFGKPDAGVDMTFDFPTLIAHAARTRSLGAGTIIGSGTVSNKGPDGGPGKPIAEGGLGYSCIAEQRTVETIGDGERQDALPRLRRHDPHRDEGQGGPFGFRRDRADGRALREEDVTLLTLRHAGTLSPPRPFLGNTSQHRERES